MRPSLLAALLLSLVAARAEAQLSPDATDRCVRSAVRIVVNGRDGQPIVSGSGTLVDTHGYVLTNFHVVGHTSPEHGVPGALFSPENRFEIATSDSARTAAEPRFLAEVVRGDIRLDLALLRIVANLDGSPVPASTRFPTVPIGTSDDMLPGTRVFAFGYPLGSRTVNVTGGLVTGFQLNADGGVAWLRSDAEFNPGNSGGMLVDESGAIVAIPTAVVHGRATLEPIELARPVERLPAEWREVMRRRATDSRIDGVPELKDDTAFDDAGIGDLGGSGETEYHFYRIHESLRPGRITTEGATPDLVLFDSSGRILRRGRGGIDVSPADPRPLLLAVVIESPLEHPIHFRIHGEAVAAPSPPPVAAAPPTPPPPVGPGIGPPPPAGSATIRGLVVDARTGQPMNAVYLVIGRPGLDLGRAISLLLGGRIPEAEFQAHLAGFTRTDALGRYEIRGLPVRTRYPAAAFAPGRRPVMLEIAVAGEGSIIELNPIAIGP